MKVLVYAGTTEGRRLAERLMEEGIAVETCVATEYGEQVLQEQEGMVIHRGRLTSEEMRELHEKGNYSAIVDGTHPYATLVSENIRKSLEGRDIPFFRLERESCILEDKGALLRRFATAKECADALAEEKSTGKVLLTTGSKELECFCQDEDLRKRLVVRVLPGRESMELCWKLGLEGKQIIAMQGPFGREMNLATIRQYEITCLVTKESGKTGGEDEKLSAAAQAGIPCLMISRPESSMGTNSYSEEEIFQKLMELAGRGAFEKKGISLDIVLAGLGMGDAGSMTVELRERLERTDYLFGAPRLLQDLRAQKAKYPYYLREDILPCLQEIQKDPSKGKAPWNVTILYSGDSGFYSGCEKMLAALQEWKEITVKVFPGISSLSAFSAKAGVSWQDAETISAHGVPWEEWAPKALLACRRNRKAFLLTSGPEDLRRLGALLVSQGLEPRILVGCQLSYPEEKILSLTPKECESLTEAGLYVAMLLPAEEKEGAACITPGWKDEAFLRTKVPMTKEEVRAISICKLGLGERAVVYDVGSGTGSVAMEMAALSGTIQVYALECDPEAVALIRQNREHFGLMNVHVAEGMAPASFEGLPVPTHAFIGGSKGRLKEILAALYQRNPYMRIVANVVSLEGMAQLQAELKNYEIRDLDIVTVSVSKAKKAGDYHLMTANNPVTIYSFSFRGGE